jgi:trigger factor
VNITLDKKSKTDGTLRISITEADYTPAVNKKIKDYAGRANIKGFRQGKVPTGVIKNMFGKSFLADEVNNLISKSITGYIKDNKLNVLGEPLPNEEKAASIDWETQKDFEFEFQVGMAEDFTVELSSKIKVTRNLIEVTDKTVGEAVEEARKRYGEVSHPETSTDDCQLFGEIKPAGTEEFKPSYIPVDRIENKQKKKFTGLKKEDTAEFQIEEITSDAALRAQILNISEDEAAAIKGTYIFKINTINVTQPAELNQEFFDKVFGKDAVQSAEAFSAKVRETIEENYLRESDHLFDHELEHYFADHVKINLPEDFLKTWLKRTDSKITDEVLQKEFSTYVREMKWNLIKEQVSEKNQIKVEATDVREKAKQMIIEQFGGAAIAEQLGDRMDAFADNYLQGNEGQNFMRLYNQLRNERIIKTIREQITIQDKKVSLDGFKKIVSEHKH